ncbi:hypothetical protein SAMN04489864_103387 [Pedobacter insulae]|uniref:Uncharacterized protein n=1 Tax=Pedobacter insulae TaxID=414048 RepID=A0A1I2W451_9SPHI|nr:hypothetical protein SAMN04489864_103387 [Pedobacter insulae]
MEIAQSCHHYLKGVTMLPNNYKRKYRFRTDTSKEKRIMNITITVTLIILFVLWYLIN